MRRLGMAEEETSRLVVGTPGRIGLWATLGSAGIGLFLALLQVQGWTMPKPLALTLGVLLLAAVAIAVSMIVVEIWRVVQGVLEHRATSASWVASTDPGLADYEADGIRAQKRFTRELNKLNRGTESLGRRLNRDAKRMTRLQGKSAKRRQRAANRSARRIHKSAVFIEKRLALLKALVKDIERNYRGFITAVEFQTEADYDAAMEFRDTVASGGAITAETLTSITGYRVAVEETEALNLSRTVRIASGRLAKGLRGIEGVFKAHERASASLVRDLDRKLDDRRRSLDTS
jgi:hypothetical protein